MFPVPVPVRRGSVRRETASSIAIFGGGLVLLQSFFFYFGSSALFPGLLTGAGIVALGAFASGLRRRREAVGAGIVLLGVASLFAGGGFYLGAVLAIVGGALVASIGSQDVHERGGSSFTSKALGPPCPNCGRHVPTWTSKCPYCGFP